MHTSVVKLRPENVVELAKDVIRPAGWNCEWNIGALQKPIQCRIVLSSWNAYLQHLIRHCQQHKGNGREMVCRLPRCNIPSGISISSYNELVQHIQLSHLSRVQLTCPIRDANVSTFSRPTLLENHFRDMHADLINVEIPRSSPFLLPSWRPFHPDCSKEPADLPQHIPLGTVLTPPVSGTARKAESQQSQESIDESFMGSQSQSLLLSPKKRPRRQLQRDASMPEEDPDTTIFFHDLPEHDKETEYEYLAVIRPKGQQMDVGRPQDILDPAQYGLRRYEGTILYDNFVRIHGLEGGDDEREDDEPAKDG